MHSHHSYVPARHCYYHGHVIGDPQSWVALDTCHGISGVIHAHGETFAITPDMMLEEDEAKEAGGPTSRRSRAASTLRHLHAMSATSEEQHEKMTHDHVVYRLQDYTPLKTVCGVTQADEQAHEHGQQAMRAAAAEAATTAESTPLGASSPAAAKSSNGTVPGEEPLVPGTKPAGKRFVELLVINDYDRYKKHGDDTEHDTLSLSQYNAHVPAGAECAQGLVC